MTSPHEEFSTTFRAALDRRPMTLSALRERLMSHGNPVSISALSAWRNGERRPSGARSLAIVADIETILGLAPGSLSSKIEPSARGAFAAPRHISIGLDEVYEIVDSVSAALLSDPLESGREMSTHIVMDVDETGRVASQAIRTRLKAVGTPITEITSVEIPPRPSDVAPIVHAVSGCRVAGRLDRPDGFGTLLALDRTVEVGRTTMIEYRQDFPEGYPGETEYRHITARTIRELLLWVRFPPDALPTWAEEVEVVEGVTTRSLRHLDGTAVHAARNDFPPGLLALKWGYEPAPLDSGPR